MKYFRDPATLVTLGGDFFDVSLTVMNNDKSNAVHEWMSIRVMFAKQDVLKTGRFSLF